MGIEIERKFLVNKDIFNKEGLVKTRIVQGFLNSNKARVVRVRITGDKGYLTIKGASDAAGLRRYEWEQEIDLKDAEALLRLSEPGKIEKNRYHYTLGKHLFEIDEFLNENEGLLLAEVELNDENEVFERPIWLGEEVTGITKYYNSELSNLPYRLWQK